MEQGDNVVVAPEVTVEQMHVIEQHWFLSEILSVTSLVLSLPALGDVLAHLLLETSCPVLKYLIPKKSSNAYGGIENWPYSEP